MINAIISYILGAFVFYFSCMYFLETHPFKRLHMFGKFFALVFWPVYGVWCVLHLNSNPKKELNKEDVEYINKLFIEQ